MRLDPATRKKQETTLQASKLRAQEVVLFETRGPVALVTLNHPESHNAITPEMACLLADMFEAFAAEPGLLVLVVTGAGGKAFCSGGDLDQSLPLLTGARLPQTTFDERVLADPDIMARAVLRMPRLEKPVIAAVNGYCLAGGMETLLGTDIRIAADHASFGLP
jgi:enoyl-CoA hydratase